MTDIIEPGGSDAAPEPAAAPTAADVPLVAQRAITAPATVDRGARTVEVVWSTGARARNFVPALGLITEELEMSPNAVRMDALRSGRITWDDIPQVRQNPNWRPSVVVAPLAPAA